MWWALPDLLHLNYYITFAMFNKHSSAPFHISPLHLGESSKWTGCFRFVIKIIDTTKPPTHAGTVATAVFVLPSVAVP